MKDFNAAMYQLPR